MQYKVIFLEKNDNNVLIERVAAVKDLDDAMKFIHRIKTEKKIISMPVISVS